MAKSDKSSKKASVKKIGYFKGVRQELAKVKWPEAKDVTKYTIATMVFCIFLAGFFVLLDFVSSVVKGLF